MGRRRRKRAAISKDIPSKANRVLNLVLIGMALIAVRVWHLGVIQHEERLEESRRPQKRVVIEPAKRGTIRDRFNIPLAINKVQYNAAVMYSQIRQIPSIKWEQSEGKKVKRYKRKEYIRELAQLLGEELALDPDRVDDLIHSKAALYNNLPYVIKEDISEKEYYRLKMLEKDWLGIHMQCVPKRYYPMGKVCGDIIGYMGAISREEYEGIIQEIKTLENCLSAESDSEEPDFPQGIASRQEAEKRLKELTEHAYSINDYVGKTGIEGRHEEQLRGFHGKKEYYSDARGNFLRELPGAVPPLSGQRFLLSISAELQEYAERLLIQNEQVRVPRVTGLRGADSKELAEKQPWMKGGAVVAMEPETGEIVAMASYPRFDPNDFIASGNPEIGQEKSSRILRWFETEGYLGEVWDQKRPLEREVFRPGEERIEEDVAMMTWERYLEFILPGESAVLAALKNVKTTGDALYIQQLVDRLAALTEQATLYPLFNLIYRGPGHTSHGPRLPAVQQEELEEALVQRPEAVLEIKKELDPFLSEMPSNYDKVLLIDLVRLLIDSQRVSAEALPALSGMSLFSYRQNTASWTVLEGAAKKMIRELYRETHFKPWRERYQKDFLKEKREQEKAEGRKYARPYLDLLDKKEREMFAEFWEINRWVLIRALLTGKRSSPDPDLEPYYQYLIAWEQELEKGAHGSLAWREAYQTLKETFQDLDKETSIALMRTFRGYKDLQRPLYGKYRSLKKERGRQLEKHLAAAFYPKYGFGYGRSQAYRQAATQGSIFKIITAYEALVQKYHKLRTRTKNSSTLNPFTMTDDTHRVGRTTYVGYDLNGKSIPQMYKGGRIPRSHRSGIGKVDLLKAFEVSSNPYFSLLAVDHLENPSDLAEASRQFSFGARTGIGLPGEIGGKVPEDLDCNRNGLYSMAIGQHSLVVTPLQTAVMLSAIANGGSILKPKIINMVVGQESWQQQIAPSKVHLTPLEVKKQIDMPAEVRQILLEGMQRVSNRTQNAAWGSLSRLYADYPEAISDLVDMKGQLLGKSSTAESVETIDLDLKMGANIYNHIWFGGIVYDKDKGVRTHTFRDAQGTPELVVVVYLRYGAWGKDTVPIAAQIAQKWREIKRKYQTDLL